jgi:hypothetical protein
MAARIDGSSRLLICVHLRLSAADYAFEFPAIENDFAADKRS